LNSKKIDQFLVARESETVEFKQSFNKEAIQTLSAFANTKGGTLLVGVNEAKEIVGIQVGNEIVQNYSNEIKQATSPSIFPTIERIDIKSVTIINYYS